jgi:uncharacterized circularly permuted ATP-grasp superfamily protein
MFKKYNGNGIYDEMFDATGAPRPHYRAVFDRLAEIGVDTIQRRHRMADLSFRNQGITFTV